MARVFYTLGSILSHQFVSRLPNAFSRFGIGKTSARDVAAAEVAVQVKKITAIDAGIASAFRVIFHFITDVISMIEIAFFSATIVQPLPLLSSADHRGLPVVRAIQSTLLLDVTATAQSRKGICDYRS